MAPAGAAELAFRELKSQNAMESMPSSKPHIGEALHFAAFLTMVVRRRWLRISASDGEAFRALRRLGDG